MDEGSYSSECPASGCVWMVFSGGLFFFGVLVGESG